MGYKNALVVLPFLAISCTAVAGQWSFTPSLNLTESYSDNLLASQDAQLSSSITQITPALAVWGRGKHLDANFIYQLANVSYQAQSELNDNYDYYSGNLGIKLFNNKWLVNLSAAKGRQVISLVEGISSRGNFVAPYQTDLANYLVSTSFASKDSNLFVYRIDLQANRINGDGQFTNREALSGSLSLSNASRLKSNYWQLSVDSNEVTSDPENNLERQDFRIYSAQTGFKFSADYWFFLQYFNQKNNLRLDSSNNLNSSSYGTGLRWYPSDKIDIKVAYNKSLDSRYNDFASIELTLKPSQRTTLYLSTGQRFYGDYYEALLSYRLKRFSSNISYNERISSYSLNFFEQPLQGDFICPISSQFSVDNCSLSSSIEPILEPGQQLISFGEFFPLEQQTFLDKRLNAKLNYTKRKVNLFFSLSHSERTILDNQGERLENYINLVTSYRINSRANVDLSLSYRDSKFNENQTTQSRAEDQVISLSFDHNLTRSTLVRLNLSHRNREATGSLSSYDENRVALSLTKEF